MLGVASPPTSIALAGRREGDGLLGFRFHDLRHIFASRLVARRVRSYIAQHAGGWRSASYSGTPATTSHSASRAEIV